MPSALSATGICLEWLATTWPLLRVGYGDGSHRHFWLTWMIMRLPSSCFLKDSAQHLGLGLGLGLLPHRLGAWDGPPEVTRKVAPSLGSVPGFRTHDTRQVDKIATHS